MNIQSILKMMGPTVLAILTALYEGLSRFGLGMLGIPYPEEPTLGTVVVTDCELAHSELAHNRRPSN
jgi:hypothetical protein